MGLPKTTMGTPGPYRAEHIRQGDRLELSNGHAIHCAPAGPDHARSVAIGSAALMFDPKRPDVATDAGFQLGPGDLRAPDLSIGGIPAGAAKGWIQGVPPLAIEYASVGQKEDDLADRIADLLRYGTQQVWVVRLVGLRHVEVHTPNAPVRKLWPGDLLNAPGGQLSMPVPVEALFDPKAARALALRHLLSDEGYASLAEVREDGVEEGREEGREQGHRAALREALTAFLVARFGDLPQPLAEHIASADVPWLQAAIPRAALAAAPGELLAT
jgi:Uma2 family endonuclease